MWFTENPWPPALLLLVGAVIFALAWTRNRRAALAGLVVLCLALIPVVFVVESWIVTPAEEIEAEILSLADTVVSGDVAATLDYFSSTAVTQRAQIATAMAIGRVEPDLRITDITTRVTNSNTIAVSQFRANGTFAVQGPFFAGERQMPTRWETSWRKEGGDWKITEVKRLNPVNGDPMPFLSRD